MIIGEIVTNAIFLSMGSFGIYVHLKEPNYMLIAGSTGIIFIILSYIITRK